jgi:hypothetical protein
MEILKSIDHSHAQSWHCGKAQLVGWVFLAGGPTEGDDEGNTQYRMRNEDLNFGAVR